MRYNDIDPYSPLETEDELSLVYLDIESLVTDDEALVLTTLDFLSQE